MTDETIQSLIGVYPVAIPDIQKTSEYKQATSRMQGRVSASWASVYEAFKIIKKKLSEDKQVRMKREIDFEKERKTEDEQIKVLERTQLLLNKQRLENLAGVLASVKASPQRISRTIQYYQREIDWTIGSIDDGYEHGTSIENCSYFEQAQYMEVEGRRFRIGVQGRIFLQDKEPLLEVGFITLDNSRWNDGGQYRPDSYSPYPNGMQLRTCVRANSFGHSQDSAKGLENLAVCNDAKEFRGFIETAKEVIKFINAPMGKVPFELTDNSLVRYSRKTGAPSRVPKGEWKY